MTDPTAHNMSYLGLDEAQYAAHVRLMATTTHNWPAGLRDYCRHASCGDEVACLVADYIKEHPELARPGGESPELA